MNISTFEPHWWRDEIWIPCEIVWADAFYAQWKYCIPTEVGRLWLKAAGIHFGLTVNNGGRRVAVTVSEPS